jgi:hypothetical protein
VIVFVARPLYPHYQREPTTPAANGSLSRSLGVSRSTVIPLCPNLMCSSHIGIANATSQELIRHQSPVYAPSHVFLAFFHPEHESRQQTRLALSDVFRIRTSVEVISSDSDSGLPVRFRVQPLAQSWSFFPSVLVFFVVGVLYAAMLRWLTLYFYPGPPWEVGLGEPMYAIPERI